MNSELSSPRCDFRFWILDQLAGSARSPAFQLKNPKSKTQNLKSRFGKRQTAGQLIQNPKSLSCRPPNPKSKI
jgi:hypothetical protein